ncbi:MAG TPA: cation-translocating P-type ATPase [Oscillatoriales cyanobacterium M4454_W2019_049]|nr:cation-translocating P-type ATPase [Oscillatoriales cyanobacterium M4454_W2019_049]
MSQWYVVDAADVVHKLGTDVDRGLNGDDIRQRQSEYGYNELIEQNLKSPWLVLWEQFTDTMVLILIVSAAISGFLGDFQEAIAIIAIVIFNACLGFKQEYQAERSLAALKKLAVPNVRVRRHGTVEEVSARELVPGDIVLLEAGNRVPADCRLLESVNLRVSEASLTGESEPVDKFVAAIDRGDLPLADRRNMAYMGTAIAYGRGVAVVTATGMNAELGRIAAAIQTESSEPTRLQQRLDRFGRMLALAILLLVGTIFVLGLLRGEDLQLMFLTAVSLGVAAVPEGLPAVVTISLALGAVRMLKKNALIRKLPAVETLGSVTTICSDKTGTLTENRMTVVYLSVAGEELDLTERLQHDEPILNPQTEPSPPLEKQPSFALLLAGAALCNDAMLERDRHRPQQFHAIGDPTEGALVVGAARLGLWKARLEKCLPRVAEVPFEGERKRMTTVHAVPRDPDSLPDVLDAFWQQTQTPSPYVAFIKGAVDSLLEMTTEVWLSGRIEPLNEIARSKIERAHNRLAQKGMRVLGVAFRTLPELPENLQAQTLEQGAIFVGIIGTIDPPRPQVRDAALACQTAGIRSIMITGDHPLTAQYIARQLQLTTNGSILSGRELDRLSPEELGDRVDSVSVYARVSPQHKLDIVRALQQQGHIVAMTGDGINDAPALKKADIGIAMGITGTDVAKEAADMVLLDDNFATIVAAIKEGRVIYDNIRKFIKYTLTGNCGELWVILLAPALGMPLPLLPLQILWINLLADGLLAVALGIEPAERNVMNRPPYKPNESVFSRGVGRDILWVGFLLGMVLLGVAWGYFTKNPEGVYWQTMVFSTLAFSRMGLAQTMRSDRDSLFSLNPLGNKPLLGAVLLTFSLQLAVIYVPFFQTLFKTTALSGIDLAVSLALSTVVFWAMEIQKWLVRRRRMSNK